MADTRARAARPGPADEDLLELALELGGSLDARTVIVRVLEGGVRLAGADRVTLSSITPQGLTIEATVGSRSGGVSWIGRSYPLEALFLQPPVREMYESREVVFGGGLVTESAYPEFREALSNVQHTAMVPILDGDDIAGMLAFSRYREPAFGDADRPPLTAFAALAGLALRNAHLYEQAAARARRLHAAIEVAAEVGSEPDAGKVLPRVVAHAAEAAGAEAAAVLWLEGDQAVVKATSGVAPAGSRWPVTPRLREQLESGAPVSMDRAELDVDGELASIADRYAQVMLVPLRIGGDTVGGLVAVRSDRRPFLAEDIESLQQFASLAALLMSNAQLVERAIAAEQTKSEFIDIAVHELRSPLAVISGYSALIGQGVFGTVGDEMRKTVGTIARKSDEARELADDLLRVARLEAGTLALQSERLVLAEVLEDVASRARERLELERGVLERSEEGSPAVLADRTTVSRILDNLVGNAIAYARGTPHVRVECVRRGGNVELRVRDSGAGIPPDERERIFERFFRGTLPGGARPPGSGLGLYLSRESARRMGGDLLLESSEEGVGSVFLLTLPAAP